MDDRGYSGNEWPEAQRVERVLSNGRRRFKAAFKTWVVGSALQPGASVAAVALANGLNANQLHRWIRQRGERQPALPALLPVSIQSGSAPCAGPEPQKRPDGCIELEVRGVQVRLRGEVAPAQLRMVLQALGQR